jgi:hypothetical protein
LASNAVGQVLKEQVIVAMPIVDTIPWISPFIAVASVTAGHLPVFNVRG